MKHTAKVRFVSCPHCNAQVAWVAENPYRPFCSERCKLIDLGGWAMEKYRVPDREEKDAPNAKEERE